MENTILFTCDQMGRASLEIIAGILRVAKNGAKKTRILCSCGLSYRLFEKYLTLLLETSLLRTGSSYYTTEKGIRFLQNYQTMELLLRTRY